MKTCNTPTRLRKIALRAVGVLTGLLFLVIPLGYSFGQGFVSFDNRIPGLLDAPIFLADGRGVGEGFTAQLYGGSETATLDMLVPLFPTTTFFDSPEGARGYIHQVVVSVPFASPGEQARMVVRVYDGATWETSSCRGESSLLLTTPFTEEFPSLLPGWDSFSLPCIPEPSTFWLVILFAPILFAGMRRRARHSASGGGNDRC